jgi:hypothetical protein
MSRIMTDGRVRARKHGSRGGPHGAAVVQGVSGGAAGVSVGDSDTHKPNMGPGGLPTQGDPHSVASVLSQTPLDVSRRHAQVHPTRGVAPSAPHPLSTCLRMTALGSIPSGGDMICIMILIACWPPSTPMMIMLMMMLTVMMTVMMTGTWRGYAGDLAVIWR